MNIHVMRRKSTWIVAVILGLAVSVAIDRTLLVEAQLRGKAAIDAEETERMAGPGDDHIPLVMIGNSSGLVNPVLCDPRDSALSLDEQIIGVQVDGEAVAYSMSAMSDGGPHIVSSRIGGKLMSITYCSIVGCARVLEEESEQVPKLRFGGQDENLQMVFMFDGRRYSQNSQRLPLKDADFTVTTLREWLANNPASKIFAG